MNILEYKLDQPCPQDARPQIDYPNLSFLPREGVQAEGNNHYITRGLFIETAPTEEGKKAALWTLAEHEVYAYGRWYPSAWMAYIHAVDEYDAARKICGNLRQWEHILKMLSIRRPHILDSWRTEQAYLQRSVLRQALMNTAVSGGPGAMGAVKTLLQVIDKPMNPVGRPSSKTKPKPEEKEKEMQSAVEEDAARILTFTR